MIAGLEAHAARVARVDPQAASVTDDERRIGARLVEHHVRGKNRVERDPRVCTALRLGDAVAGLIEKRDLVVADPAEGVARLDAAADGDDAAVEGVLGAVALSL